MSNKNVSALRLVDRDDARHLPELSDAGLALAEVAGPPGRAVGDEGGASVSGVGSPR